MASSGDSMESLRLQGNAHFGADPAKAAALYQEAMSLYEHSLLPTGAGERTEAAGCTLEEYTKCAGNALTCLSKLGQRAACVALAQRALRLNPIFAKANAFIGRATCEDEGLLPSPETTPLLFLCRAVYLLPTMEESARASIDTVLDCLLAVKAQGSQIREAEGGAAAASVVEVRSGGSSGGNGVVAIADVPAFALVSDMRQPFSVASYEETGGHGLCACCGRCIAQEPKEEEGSDAQSHGCAVCKLAFYCSAQCEAAHKPARHEPFECAKLRKLKEMTGMIESRGLDVPAEFFDIAAHTIATLAAYQAQRPGWDQLAQLESHAREVAVSLNPTAPLLHDLYSDVPTLSKDFITEVVGIIRCNSLEIAEPSGMGVGQALYCGRHSLTSFFNHSCAPNCAIDSTRHGIVATRAIHAGEELCISYLPQLYWPCRLRQDRLSEHFYFMCRCLRCEGSATDPFEKAVQMELPRAAATSGNGNSTAELHVKVQSKCNEVRSLSVEEISAAHVEAIEALQRVLDKRLFPFHYLQHELRNLLSFVHAVLGNAPACLSSCLQELLLWESTVPGALPVKQMKVHNALQCLEGQQASEERGAPPCMAALRHHLLKLALVYDVAEEDTPSQ